MAIEDEDEFSYERDIAPINRRFFDEIQRKGLPPKAMLAASRASRQIGDEYYSREAAIRKADMELASSNLRMQADMMNLEKVRRNSANRRLELEQTRMLGDTFARALGDPSVPAEQRPNEIRRIALAAAPIIANNEGAKEAFNNALELAKPIKREGPTVQDYIDKGYDTEYLSVWSQKNNAPLSFDSPLPIGVYATGKEVADAKRRKLEIESGVAREQALSAARAPEQRKQKVAESLEQITLVQDILKPEVLKFKDESDIETIRSAVNLYGTPDDKKNFDSMNAIDKARAAKRIRANLIGGVAEQGKTQREITLQQFDL
jgi:hypothetical protein